MREAVEEPPIVDAQPIESPEPAVVEMDTEVVAPGERDSRASGRRRRRVPNARREGEGRRTAARGKPRPSAPLEVQRTKSRPRDR